jgi:AraC-like DNA-binding protein
MQPDIATYQLHTPGSLRLQTMEDIYRAARGQVDHPHRHDYYTVIIVEQGTGEHRVDFQSFPLAERQVHFVSPGQVHQLVATAEPRGWVLSFTTAFLLRNGIQPAFIADINLFRDYGQAPPLELTPRGFAALRPLLAGLREAQQQPGPFQYEAIGAWLKLLLIACRHQCSLTDQQHTQLAEAGGELLRGFKALVEAHFTQWHKVSDYAQALAITADHLNKTIKSLIGVTAKQYIQSRLTVAAKRELLFSAITVKELAYDLGFDTPSHFSAFFKNCTGLSPRAFRENTA